MEPFPVLRKDELNAEQRAPWDELTLGPMAERTPQRRIGRPEEVGAVAAFLLSDDASHVTAQSLAVDGGLLGTLPIR